MKNLRRTLTLMAILFTTTLVTKAQNVKPGMQETGETINVTGSGIDKTIEATGNENINIEGSSINVVITGNCNSIKVVGAAIRVKAQGVRNIRIQGADSGVTYTSSPNKNGKAISSVSGAASYVTKIKP
ncbi:DUF3060 domain-containing protein [Pedobacter petrophilus]|uniref:DUF3060 domain-containing protein n=1 Tax=Pedobacter petrophilus TaxID=1908241 RepID=A0A7K0FZS1_9SPHI|nr:DUF3060 domain-containing protein [Pedobacter petrophilus]MRX76246.1 DUF3060 domain-containing protein [Pedobacter petrophilus]